MPTPERFLAVLKEQLTKHALEALNPGKGDQSEFGYGKACGISLGLQTALALLEDAMTTEAAQEVENGSQSRPAKR